MMDKLLILVLESRLRRYKRDERHYKKIGDNTNWYTSMGIPALELEILILKNKKK